MATMYKLPVQCLALLALAVLGIAKAWESDVSTSSSHANVHLKHEGGAPNSFRVEFDRPAGESVNSHSQEDGVQIEWSDKTRLESETTTDGRTRVTTTSDIPFKVCWSLKGQHLYGGPIVNSYPAEKSKVSNVAYLTGDMTRFGHVQAVTERYWYTSSGVNIKVDPEVPLFVSQNSEELCLHANNTYPYSTDPKIQFSFETCLDSSDLRKAVSCFYTTYQKPIPPASVIASPIWSTWVEFERNITQDIVLGFYENIKQHDMKLSVLEVDDSWETCYGSEEFDKARFPDPKAMVDKVHSEGKLVTLWVHPFVGPGCPSFEPYAEHLVKLPNGSVGITEWWNGKGAALINFNDPKTVEWYQQRLVNLQKDYGFDSFKFDAGEAAYIPGLGKDEKLIGLNRPNQFTTNYVRAASKFGPLAEARVGSEAAKFNLMQRLQDTNSEWGSENWGLRSVLMSVFQLSLHGYGAILPDMVGGNCYQAKPSKELFIRWLQLNTFLPVIQFSLAPWKFDQETVDISKHYTNLHYQYTDKILKEFKDWSHPVNNPIWWIAPEDPIAQATDSEFLLGEDLLVAPVLEEGATSRNIYLPKGLWRDMNTKDTIKGPTTLKNYNAPLHVLPYFQRIQSS